MNAKKVLIIDNDLFFTSKISDVLKKMKFIPVVTAKSADLVKLLKENEISLLILDLAFDGLDTLALIEKLKSCASTEAIPIIGFGEHTDTNLLQGAQDAGCEIVVSNRNLVKNLKDLVEASLIQENPS